MSIFNSTESHYWRNIVTRVSLVVITVAIIVWFLPRNESQRFHYDIGKPWMYGSFIAKFDFPIYKTDEAIKAEQDSLMMTYEPYYNYDEKVESEQVGNFIKDFKDGIPGLPKQYLTIIVDRLHRLYQAGIMNTSEDNDI